MLKPPSFRTMAKLLCAPLVAALVALASSATMAEEIGCDAKRAHIKDQLENARQNHQSHRAAGLQRALTEVEAHCTTASLIDESRDKLADLEEEQREQRQELKEAQRDDDREDIAKHQRKLDAIAADIEAEQERAKALRTLPEST